jgi:hypothetical protein
MSLDNFKIVLQDGTTYDMAEDFSVLVRSFRISSPAPSRQTEQIDGRDGQIRLGKDYGPREITAVCSFFAVDYADSLLLRDEIIRVVYGREPYYIVPEATPGKRWLVEASDSITPELIGMYGEFSLSFISDSTYAESIGTTLDPLTFDAELWQVGEGLTVDMTDYTQTHDVILDIQRGRHNGRPSRVSVGDYLCRSLYESSHRQHDDRRHVVIYRHHYGKRHVKARWRADA